MSRKRIESGRNQTNAENKRRFDDLAAAIDMQMSEAFDAVDAKRKARAAKSLRAFIDTYMLGFVLESKPSEMTYRAIGELEAALLDNRPVQIQLPRGSGKTTLASIAVLYLLSTARRKFAVIVSQNARSAANILADIWRMVIEDSPYSQDFPEMSKPFQLCNGAYRRRQTFRGIYLPHQERHDDSISAFDGRRGKRHPHFGCGDSDEGDRERDKGLEVSGSNGQTRLRTFG